MGVGREKEKKRHALARFKDHLVDFTSETEFPSIPHANELAKRVSIPRDEDGNPKMPWELSSKSRVHDERKFYIKKNKVPLPKYVSQVKAEEEAYLRAKAIELGLPLHPPPPKKGFFAMFQGTAKDRQTVVVN